jgi:hypothetical protein
MRVFLAGEANDFLHAFAKECANKGLRRHSSLKEYENKGVAKSTFRDHAKEYQNKGLNCFCPHCGVRAVSGRFVVQKDEAAWEVAEATGYWIVKWDRSKGAAGGAALSWMEVSW